MPGVERYCEDCEHEICKEDKKETCTELLQRLGTDGQKWAKEFVKLVREKKLLVDEEMMVGWFCNSIKAGFDEANNRRTK